ncbi:fumarylacetoacetate hydrolase family protein [Chitinimonas arctica]|uniref:Fumarylacetoacetate hydrolase family protein n=1 Tax=Chitinimonas arctica TaxID=2594795 RepID=A0A516SHK4_9NEIS|nr:fumarylacetoacetate hydrolase family protein [Chitinimonas arctica]QDQ27623.1 fumarylacetoacetate hydrolase family protein [Chitinimonas arctica]
MPSIFFNDGREIAVGNIFCIGRNYAAHAAELGNRVEPEPVVFLKPTSALLQVGQAIQLPDFSSDVHHEAELVLAIGRGGKRIDRASALDHVAGYGMGLDLTARDLQTAAKQGGLPWTLSKGFDGSACVSHFVPASALPKPDESSFSLEVNGELRQRGDCRLMVYDIPFLIEYLSTRFSLQAGDLIYTGTPAGVAALRSGDSLLLKLDGLIEAHFDVA